MSTATLVNGIDVAGLVETIEAIGSKPDLASFTFRAKTTWQEGTRSTAEVATFRHADAEDRSRSEPFVLTGDEPPVLLGHNAGPNAVELLLAALGLCYSVGIAANAAARGIHIEAMSYDVEGDIDLHAFLGLGDGGRPGFTAIRARAAIKAPGTSEETLRELCSYVQKTSPVRDTLANAVTVETTLRVL